MLRAVGLSSALVIALSTFAGAASVPMPIDVAAPIMLNRSHNAGCGVAKDSGFKAQLDFGAAAAVVAPRPWESIDFIGDPEGYMHAVLDQAIAANEPIAWDIGKHPTNGWIHAPWMAQDREPSFGMTRERGSDPHELHPNQGTLKANYAVGFYNSIAAAAFRDMWANPAQPATASFRMPPGAVAVKLLFTTATDSEVPYLTGSRELTICANGSPTKVLLTQVDIAVRDSRADQWTGWVFGTFVHWDTSATSFDWANVKPFTLTWGNDPTVWPAGLGGLSVVTLGDLPPIQQSWFNKPLQDQFAAWRLQHDLFPWTGVFGRGNGPIDDPVSSCLSCHNVAADFGRGSEQNPFMKPADGWVASVRNGAQPGANLLDYFVNRGPSEPKLQGTLALDYSLQAMIGLLNFRSWAECRGDIVTADLSPAYSGNRPAPLTPAACQRVLAATGDVTFDPENPALPATDNLTIFKQTSPETVLKTMRLEGGTLQLPFAERQFRGD